MASFPSYQWPGNETNMNRAGFIYSKYLDNYPLFFYGSSDLKRTDPSLVVTDIGMKE